MKILLVHNYYGSSAPSGENKVFEAEKAMLEKYGHEVEVYTRHSDEIRSDGRVEHVDTCRKGFGRFRKLWGMIKGAMCTVGNPFAARAVARKCREFKPDVVHFHNTFPLISPLAVRAASKYAPVVMTLHNYRTACAAGVPTRDGKVCSLCLDKKCVWDGIKHRCYRGSLAATLPLAINIALYRRLLPKWVTKFIVLSEFQKRKMVEYGWPAEKIAVKGNFVKGLEGSGSLESSGGSESLESSTGTSTYQTSQTSQTFQTSQTQKKDQIVYVGRLSKEKGVETLINAFRILNGRLEHAERAELPNTSSNLHDLHVLHGQKTMKLVIVGDGVDRQELEKLAEELDVEFVGLKSAAEVRRLMAESKATVLPSEWWETFGLTVVESMLQGTPVVVSNLGALPDIVQDGRFGEVFEAGNVEACAEAIKRLLSRPDYDEMCASAKREANARYSEESNCARLMEIYESLKCAD